MFSLFKALFESLYLPGACIIVLHVLCASSYCLFVPQLYVFVYLSVHVHVLCTRARHRAHRVWNVDGAGVREEGLASCAPPRLRM